ncbi:MAG: ribosomal protein S18-alanine N-acetyltransferase [Micrococcaceae bacterium]
MNITATKLRAASIEDLTEICSLENTVFTHDAWSSQLLREELLDPSRKYFVALDGQQIIGYGGIALAIDFCDIMTLAVAEEYRGQGVGKQLVETLLRQARSNVLLEVRADNTSAISLYTLYGFVEIAQRKNYYPGKVDALVMMKEIS